MNLKLGSEVAAAKRDHRPIVALESTIIAHGMPYPQNLEVARQLHDDIRSRGAVPATIAVIAGEVVVGCNDDELKLLATHDEVMKLSRRDLPWAMAFGKHGATTVAATMIAAKAADVTVFATGGIGGVHRGASQSFDVSADLNELGRTSVAVVCAGPKAILDLPATMEVLETQGVPVVGYQTDELPAFYTRESGIPLELRADHPDTIARFLQTKWQSGLSGGVLIANPIPKDHSFDKQVLDAHIAKAMDAATAAGIEGKAVTPFLLSKVKELTAGKSLEANIALVRNNARLAAEIAKSLTV